jgi:hypothetical protein
VRGDLDALDALDRLDLADLVTGYAAAVDDRAWDRLGALFTVDAVLLSPDVPRSLGPVLEARGRAAVLDTVQQLSRFARTFHHVTGSIWTADGRDGALGRSTAVAHHVEVPARGTTTDGAPDGARDGARDARSWVWHVVYEDRCRRTAAGWQFSRRSVTAVMIESRPVARLLPPDGPSGQ